MAQTTTELFLVEVLHGEPRNAKSLRPIQGLKCLKAAGRDRLALLKAVSECSGGVFGGLEAERPRSDPLRDGLF